MSGAEAREREELMDRLLETIASSSRTSLRLALVMLRHGREVPGRIDAKLRGLKGARSAPREEDMDRDRYLAYAEARILYGKGWGAGDGVETAEVVRPDQKDLRALLERGKAAEAGSWVREGRSHLVDEADQENEERILGAVAKAVPDPASRTVDEVRAALALGATPQEAWARVPTAFAPIAAAICRSQESGAPLAQVLALTAEDLRRAHRGVVQAAARAAGVRVVGPLALCFLPAYLLLGVVPIVASLARGLFT